MPNLNTYRTGRRRSRRISYSSAHINTRSQLTSDGRVTTGYEFWIRNDIRGIIGTREFSVLVVADDDSKILETYLK